MTNDAKVDIAKLLETSQTLISRILSSFRETRTPEKRPGSSKRITTLLQECLLSSFLHLGKCPFSTDQHLQ